MLADGTVCLDVRVNFNLAARDVREVRLDVKGEGTKLLDVYTFSSPQVVVQVGD